MRRHFLLPVLALALWSAATAIEAFTGAPSFAIERLIALASLLAVALPAAFMLRRGGRLRVTGGLDGIDPDTGISKEAGLRTALEAELARSHRFNRGFALVLVDTRPMDRHARRRDKDSWRASYVATARLLLRTRLMVDRVYSHGHTGFAMVLPESGPREVLGLIRRLRRLAALASPPEGQPGGPLPVVFGATFFPGAATSVNSLLARAGVALKLAGRAAGRYHFDGAESPPLPAPESFRNVEDDEAEMAAPAVAPAGDETAPDAAAQMANAAEEDNGGTADGEVEMVPAVAGPEWRSYISELVKDMGETQEMLRRIREPCLGATTSPGRAAAGEAGEESGDRTTA